MIITLTLLTIGISAITLEEKRFHRENKQFYEGLDVAGNTLQNRHDKRMKEFREFLDANK